jgi:hypothetical protein
VGWSLASSYVSSFQQPSTEPIVASAGGNMDFDTNFSPCLAFPLALNFIASGE